MHGPTCIFWANLTPFSLQHLAFTRIDVGGCSAKLLGGRHD
jgi:hypothetical protein